MNFVVVLRAASFILTSVCASHALFFFVQDRHHFMVQSLCKAFRATQLPDAASCVVPSRKERVEDKEILKESDSDALKSAGESSALRVNYRSNVIRPSRGGRVEVDPSMNRAESFVQKKLIQQGWNTSPMAQPLTLQSFDQSTVREVLYTNYERLVKQQLPFVVLSGPDNDVVWSVLQLHPRAVEKMGSGISLFVLSRNVNNHKTPCFFLARTDGTVADFAIKKCFSRVPKGDETSWRRIMDRLIAAGQFSTLY